MSATVEEMREAAALLCDAVPMTSPGYGTAMRLAAAIRELPVAPAVADLATIEERERAATLGPCSTCCSVCSPSTCADCGSCVCYGLAGNRELSGTIAFLRRDLATARADVPTLLRLVREGAAREADLEHRRQTMADDFSRMSLQYINARVEADGRRAQMAEARGLLSSALQSPDWMSPEPTPEEMAVELFGTNEGFSVGCMRDGAAAGVRAERKRARRGDS